MERIRHHDPESTYTFRTRGLEPYKIEVRGRLVCGVHDYSEPDHNGIQHCECGASRHECSEI